MQKLFRDVTNPLQLLKNFWEIYVQTAVTYGINAMFFPGHFVEQLEKSERMTLKSILGLPQYTKNEVPYVLLNMHPLSRVLYHNRLTYWLSIKQRQGIQWIKDCMEVPSQWARRDGLMDERGWINEVKVSNGRKSYFLREVVSMSQINPQYFQQILGVERKKYIAVSLNMEWRASLVRFQEEHVPLKYLNL